MTLSRSTSVMCLTLLAASFAHGQGPTSPTPPPPPAAPASPAPRIQRYTATDRNRMDRDMEHGPGAGGNMGILPPGAWWKNPDIVTALSLTVPQQNKMDDILRQNRIALIDLKASLEKEQINLEPLLNANPVDSAKTMAEISKVADLRAGLEKANAKMLLGLRSVLTAEQWTKLQDQQHMHRKAPMPGEGENGMRGGKGGPVRGPGPSGPGAPPPPPPPPTY